MSKTGTQLIGKYRAQVVDIKDPEKRGRILVKSPKVLNNHQLGWAESCFMPGHFFLPRKNDWVWIEFEGGDVHKPIWVGIMPTRAYVRDYLMPEDSSYSTTRASIKHYEGGIDVYTNGSVSLISGNDIILTATDDINVKGTDLLNNNSWSK